MREQTWWRRRSCLQEMRERSCWRRRSCLWAERESSGGGWGLRRGCWRPALRTRICRRVQRAERRIAVVVVGEGIVEERFGVAVFGNWNCRVDITVRASGWETGGKAFIVWKTLQRKSRPLDSIAWIDVIMISGSGWRASLRCHPFPFYFLLSLFLYFIWGLNFFRISKWSNL